MIDNITGIFNQLWDGLEQYETHQRPEDLTPHERVLDILERDYMRMGNHNEWLAALRGMISEEEALVWCLYPEYTRTEQGITIAQAAAKAKNRLPVAELTRSLVDKGLLYEYPGAGECTYVETYLLDVVYMSIICYDDSPLHRAAVHWFNKVSLDGAESRQLRLPRSEHRILPHEAVITGDQRHGRIPMNMDIPDTRQVLDFDKASEMFRRLRRICVVSCICRKSKDLAGIRKCDYPVDDICFLFDESADAAVAAGLGREISYEEAMDILSRCRDTGLVQVISNAEHPLALCNCCECCCLCLLSLGRNEYTMTECSRYIVEIVRPDDCIGCGACGKVCPAHAIELTENGIQMGKQQCYGCGLCVSRCPGAVLRMAVKPGAPDSLEREYLRRIYL